MINRTMMKRGLSFGLLLIFIIGASFVFTDEIELPEPVFYAEVSAPITPVSSAPIGLWFPGFEEVVYYLWNFDYVDQNEAIRFLPYAALAQSASSDYIIPANIRNNRYFIESVRLTNLAQTAYEDGDYDNSTQYSEEAIRYAHLSDEYVRLQLKIKEADDAIAAARMRLEYAGTPAIDAASRYPSEYAQAQIFYNDARNYRSRESWDEAITAANRVMNLLAMISEGPTVATVTDPSEYPLPAQYTVRTWELVRDCFWNIAGRPWAYGDPNQWRLLYNANRTKLPQLDNPDLIHPGMVLDIPSIRGETREGMWAEGRNYAPLR